MSDNQKLCTLLDIQETLSNADDVWEPLLDYTKYMGVDGMGYYHLSPPGAIDGHEQLFLAWEFDESVIERHRHIYLSLHNPLKDRALIDPIFWSRIFSKLTFSESDRLHLKDLYFNDHMNGIVIPVHGPTGRSGVFVLRFQEACRRYSKQEIRSIQWACQYTHQTFCKLRSKTRKQLTALTTREKEVLSWVAKGKSNSVIADIVGISQHTVNGYLRRIYLKTGTSDRTTASLRGIGEALINY